MDTTNKKIQVQARVRIISSIKGLELTRPENIAPIVEIKRSAIFQPKVAQALVDAATREAFAKEFRRRMKEDPGLRRMIGGTRWSVDLIHFNFKDAV